MDRKPFTIFLTIFIVELLVVIITAEPTSYRHHRGIIINNDQVDINCATDKTNSSKCRLNYLNRNATRSIDIENNGVSDDKKVDEENKMSSLMDWMNDDDNDGAVEEGRGKKKRKGMGKMLVMIAAAMKATLLYAMIHGVAIIAGKALVVAKIALALAAALALKKALDQPKTSYEIVKHPQHSYSQTHSASVDYDHHGGGYDGQRRRRKKRFAR